MQQSIPNRAVEPGKEAQHCAASATTVLVLWEVLSSGSSTPLTPCIRKLSDLCIGLKSWFHHCALESCWLCCSVCGLIMPGRPERAKVQYNRGGDIYFHSQVGAGLSKMLQEMQLEKKPKPTNLLFTAVACLTQLQGRISAGERNRAVSGRKSWRSVQKAQTKIV